MERLINRREQGDLGEASAIEWLTRQGATVSVPLGHSPDYDLIAEIDGRLLRVQVKTSTFQRATPDGHVRWDVSISTNGGNQSWSGCSKRFDQSAVDALFILVGDGRRWIIPASQVEATSSMRLGGRRYSECEIEPAEPIISLVYSREVGTEVSGSKIDRPIPGERRRRRVGLDCKSSASMLSGFDSHLPHLAPEADLKPADKRQLGSPGQAIIRRKRQMTMPVKPFTEAGLRIGDRLRFRADGPERIVIERIGEPDLKPRASSAPQPAPASAAAPQPASARPGGRSAPGRR
jgi:hypothetical protein